MRTRLRFGGEDECILNRVHEGGVMDRNWLPNRGLGGLIIEFIQHLSEKNRILMLFSPSSATWIIARPVCVFASQDRATGTRQYSTVLTSTTETLSVLTPMAWRYWMSHMPSSPTEPRRSTRPPAFAMATAWFAPLPPARRSYLVENIVSPARTRFFTVGH